MHSHCSYTLITLKAAYANMCYLTHCFHLFNVHFNVVFYAKEVVSKRKRRKKKIYEGPAI